jgi:IclR family acetate operon transcriptional repressor
METDDSRGRLSSASSGRDVKSAERALAVLALLGSGAERPLASAAIARRLGIPRSSAYRLLGAMRRAGFIDQDGAGGGWRLDERTLALCGQPSPALVLRALECLAAQPASLGALAARLGVTPAQARRLRDLLLAEGALVEEEGELRPGLRLAALAPGSEALARLRERVRPVLVELRERTGETANLVLANGGHGLYVEQVESPHALRHAGWVGRQIPLDGATGRALAGAPGVHVAVGAVEEGVVAIAAGIPAPAGLTAALSLTGPAVRLDERAIRSAAAALAEAVESLAAGAALSERRRTPGRAAGRHVPRG